MHWFLEQVKDYYPEAMVHVQPYVDEGDTCYTGDDFGTDDLYLIFSVIEFGGVLIFGKNEVESPIDLRSGFVLETSGTTGVPKQVLYDFDVFLEKFRGVKHNPIKTLMVMGIDHIGGMDVYFSTISRGGTVIFPKEITPKCIGENIEKHEINFISLSPSFLNLMLLSDIPKLFDLSSLQTVNFGAEVMPSGLLARLQQALPEVVFKQTFGTTETGTVRVERHPENPLLIKIPDSRIIDSKLYIKAKHGMVRYLNQPNPIVDGYFPTGDVVEQHGDYIKILGRERDYVNIGGEKVSLNEVENLLFEIEHVKDVKVYSQDNAILGKMLVAEVVWQSGEDCKTCIRNFLRDKVEKHRIPSKIKAVDKIAQSTRLKKVRDAR